MAEANAIIRPQKICLGGVDDMFDTQPRHRDPSGMDSDTKLQLDGLVHEYDRGMDGNMVVGEGHEGGLGEHPHRAQKTISFDRIVRIQFFTTEGTEDKGVKR